MDISTLQGFLDDLCAEHGMPGASVAVLRDGELTAAASGVLNVATGVEATPDSVFQIGSIAKTYTATMAMSLHDDGRLDLDARVADVIGGFRLANAADTDALTVRHLMTHTNGIDGDHVTDTGRGDDCLERFIDTLPDAAQLFPPGEIWSYSNTGFVLLGRLIEVLTEGTWDEALASRICQPLGLTHTSGLPEDVLRHRAAYGHIGVPAELAPVWSLPRSWGPAGGALATTATELARYGLAHLDGPLLSEGSRLAMREPQVTLPAGSPAVAWGLGWALMDWDGTSVFGHDGGTIGQASLLRVLPAQRMVISVMTNCRTNADVFGHAVLTEVLGGEDVHVPALCQPEPGVVPALDGYVGRYARAGMALDLVGSGSGYAAHVTLEGALAAAMGTTEVELPIVAGGQGRVLSRLPGDQDWMPVGFGHFSDGRPYLLLGQALARVGD